MKSESNNLYQTRKKKTKENPKNSKIAKNLSPKRNTNALVENKNMLANPKKSKPQEALTSKQCRYLRSIGHHLHPVVMVGKDGVTDSVVKAVSSELLAHELIKIKLLDTTPESVFKAVEQISVPTNAQVAQILGRTVLLYKANPDNPIIDI